MAKKLFQYRYYNDGDSKNNPNTKSENEIPPTKISLVNGGAFVKRMPIVQLGVQAPPGTKLYLNGGYDPVIIGVTGILELDLQDGAQITSMRFDQASIENIIENEVLFLMVDILYEED